MNILTQGVQFKLFSKMLILSYSLLEVKRTETVFLQHHVNAGEIIIIQHR